MIEPMGRAVKVGGQALADGVLRRTDRAWAIARADGTIESGVCPPNRFAKVPVFRVIAGLVGAMKLGIGRGMLQGRNKLNRRYLWVMAVAELFLVFVPHVLPWASPSGRYAPVAIFVSWVGILVALRVCTPAALWRYHGAEHKAVSAYEAGCDAGDVGAAMDSPRIHDRCGTNLVVLMVVLAMALSGLAGIWQVPLFLLGLGASVEILNIAARRPDAALSRLLLGGGKAVQRHITTSEPTRDEQTIACRALLEAIRVHERAATPALAD